MFTYKFKTSNIINHNLASIRIKNFKNNICNNLMNKIVSYEFKDMRKHRKGKR